jgi:hypothetical protein
MPSLREALRRARELGARVEPIHRTGEIRVAHPRLIKSLKINNRRKGCPMALWVALKRMAGACPRRKEER